MKIVEKNIRILGPFAIIVVGLIFLAPGIARCAEPNDCNGPTVLLSYTKETFPKNPISSFMYFVPLISVSLVECQTSPNNDQIISLTSYERTADRNFFYVACEFKIQGKGFYKNTYDSAGMIAAHVSKVKKGQPLAHMLDYIKFEGEGVGRIEVSGTITDSVETVTKVELQFNAGGCKSPVTVGLYDIKPKGGHYNYENRSNQIVARVNVITFTRSQDDPVMAMKLASINKAESSETFLGRIKGMLANLFISPTEVDKLGNDTMLDFGYALFKQKPSFTFPKAKNLKETK